MWITPLIVCYNAPMKRILLIVALLFSGCGTIPVLSFTWPYGPVLDQGTIVKGLDGKRYLITTAHATAISPFVVGLTGFGALQEWSPNNRDGARFLWYGFGEAAEVGSPKTYHGEQLTIRLLGLRIPVTVHFSEAERRSGFDNLANADLILPWWALAGPGYGAAGVFRGDKFVAHVTHIGKTYCLTVEIVKLFRPCSFVFPISMAFTLLPPVGWSVQVEAVSTFVPIGR